jgi:hypothetical protein
MKEVGAEEVVVVLVSVCLHVEDARCNESDAFLEATSY